MHWCVAMGIIVSEIPQKLTSLVYEFSGKVVMMLFL